MADPMKKDNELQPKPASLDDSVNNYDGRTADRTADRDYNACSDDPDAAVDAVIDQAFADGENPEAREAISPDKSRARLQQKGHLSRHRNPQAQAKIKDETQSALYTAIKARDGENIAKYMTAWDSFTKGMAKLRLTSDGREQAENKFYQRMTKKLPKKMIKAAKIAAAELDKKTEFYDRQLMAIEDEVYQFEQNLEDTRIVLADDLSRMDTLEGKIKATRNQIAQASAPGGKKEQLGELRANMLSSRRQYRQLEREVQESEDNAESFLYDVDVGQSELDIYTAVKDNCRAWSRHYAKAANMLEKVEKVQKDLAPLKKGGYITSPAATGDSTLPVDLDWMSEAASTDLKGTANQVTALPRPGKDAGANPLAGSTNGAYAGSTEATYQRGKSMLDKLNSRLGSLS